jgi:hypothetical protein
LNQLANIVAMKIQMLPVLLLLLLPSTAPAQWSFTTNNDGTLTLTSYTGTNDMVTVPGTANNRTVTAIGYAAFYDSGLTSVTIPDSVTSIDNEAFNYCLDLNSITIGSGVTNIGSYAFIYCFSLEAAYFRGNVPGYDATLFSGDDGVTVYYLPGTTNWENFAQATGLPTVLWNPQAQTGDGSFGVRNHQFGFNITGTADLVIIVEACTNLANPVWTPVATNTLTSGSSYFSDPQWTSFSSRYYRFRSP